MIEGEEFSRSGNECSNHEATELFTTGFVCLRLTDGICVVTAPRGTAINIAELPDHLARHLREIRRLMRRQKFVHVEIPLSPDDSIYVDNHRRSDYELGDEEKLRTFAILVVWFSECREKVAVSRGQLASLHDLREQLGRRITDLEFQLETARQRFGEISGQIEETTVKNAALEADFEFGGRKPSQTTRDRASQSLPRGHHIRRCLASR